MLKNLRFRCRNKVGGCEISALNYEEAQKHLKYCKFQEFYCPFKCLDENKKCTKLSGSQIEKHIKIICSEMVEECEKCGQDKKRSEEHDCFQTLKK